MSRIEPAFADDPSFQSRRSFFRRAGFGLGAAALATSLQACDTGEPEEPMEDDDVILDFSDDFGVLNYAYALEQLEAAFYATVTGASGFSDIFDADEQTIMRDLAAHEAIHRDFFEAAISGAGGTPIPGLTPNFDAVDFGDRASVLATALTFEDLGVSAYNGAGKYIQSSVYLTLAGKIVSVEARHASVVAGLITPNAIAGDDQIDENGLDLAREPGAVLSAASDFIEDTIVVRNIPSA